MLPVGNDTRGARAAIRTGAALPFEPGAAQARRRGRLELLDLLDRGAAARAQFVGLARHAQERAAGLLAGQHVGDARRIERRLEQVDGGEALRAPCAHSLDRSGNGRTGSLPSQPTAALRIRSNILPFGPSTSDSSITAPGWYSVSK